MKKWHELNHDDSTVALMGNLKRGEDRLYLYKLCEIFPNPRILVASHETLCPKCLLNFIVENKTDLLFVRKELAFSGMGAIGQLRDCTIIEFDI